VIYISNSFTKYALPETITMASLDILPLIIDNEPVHPDGARVATTTSTNTNGPYVKYVSASVYEAVRAVESSHKAFLSWSRTQPHVRSGILRQVAALLRENAQELVQLQVAETNCPELWGRINVLWAALHLEEMAGRITSALMGELPVVQTPGQIGLVFKRPVGPVLSIPP
jgi:acyl-CoA reductase-like NAD-dependent aldehyde dehydrogenase